MKKFYHEQHEPTRTEKDREDLTQRIAEGDLWFVYE